MKRFLLIVALVAMAYATYSQSNLYVKSEVAAKWDFFECIGSDDYLYYKPSFSQVVYGMDFGMDFGRTFGAEIGILLNETDEGYRLHGDIGYGFHNALYAIQIPLRWKARINLLHQKLFLTSILGYTFAINTEYGSSSIVLGGFTGSSTPRENYNDSSRINYSSDYSLRKTYSLIESGLELHYKFSNGIGIGISTTYLKGFNKIIESDIEYRIDDQPWQCGKAYFRGDYFSVAFGIQYNVLKFKEKKPYKCSL